MKQSLAARFLFRAVVLALLVYAILLTWWTPFTGDSFMHSVFGAGHRLASVSYTHLTLPTIA